MSDEVYEGAIGIDLGMLRLQPQPLFVKKFEFLLTESTRHDLFLRCQLRGNQCRDQYAPLIPSYNGPIFFNIRFAVANEQGSFTTPSFVSFTSEERLIGEAAKNQAAMNPANTVFDVK
jgi:hypothetical protein